MLLKLFLFSLALIEISGLQTSESEVPTFVLDEETNTLIKNTDYNCTKEGLMCEGCEKSVLCILINGVYVKYDVETCGEDRTCSESSGTCVSGSCTSPGTPGSQEYDCRMNGVFPDLNNCSKYYSCVEKAKTEEEEEEDLCEEGVDPCDLDIKASNYESHPYECDSGYYFNSKRGICNLKTTDKCSVANVICIAPGQMGAIPNNPSIYYICLPDMTSKATTTYPKLFMCPNVKEFDATLRYCVDNSPESGLNANGSCIQTGRFYDPTSCNHYKTCGVIGATPSRNLCANNYKFNPATQACVPFSCDEIV